MERGAILISGKCNYGCAFCGAYMIHDSLDDDKFVDDMEKKVEENIQYHISNGTDELEISGNDPGDYYDIVNLIKHIKSFPNFKKVLLSTNGMRASKMLNELKEAGLDSLVFPVYGHTEEVLLGTIKQKGALKTIKDILQFSEIELVPHIEITKANYKYLLDIIKFIIKNSNDNIDFIRIGRIFVADNNWDYFATMDEIRPYVKEIFDYVYENQNVEGFPNFIFDLENCLIEHQNNIFSPSYGPKMGEQQYNSDLKTEIDDVPNYRIRQYSENCKKCVRYDTCLGMLKSEFEKFGDMTKPLLL